MAHVDPDVLALSALGERDGTSADQQHLTDCADCRAELARLAEVVRVARSADRPEPLISPPAAVWTRIAQALEPDGGVAPAARARRDHTATPEHARRRSFRLVPVIAASLLIGAGAAVAVTQLSRQQTEVVGTTTLRPLPEFPQWRAASGSAAMEKGPGGWLLKVTLHAPPGHGFFEVWLLGRDGVRMISLGDLSTQGTGTFTVPAGADLSFYSRVDISLQPFDGSTGHSKVSVVRGPLP